MEEVRKTIYRSEVKVNRSRTRYVPASIKRKESYKLSEQVRYLKDASRVS